MTEEYIKTKDGMVAYIIRENGDIVITPEYLKKQREQYQNILDYIRWSFPTMEYLLNCLKKPR
jgi:hypothetical protein